MYKDYYDYDHPALYLYLVEQTAAGRAWKFMGNTAKNRKEMRALGNRRVRHSIKQYLQTASKPRLRRRAIGNSYDII